MLWDGAIKVGHGRQLRQPKIRHLGVHALIQKDIAGLDVPMENGRIRLCMQVQDAPRRPKGYVQSPCEAHDLRGCVADNNMQSVMCSILMLFALTEQYSRIKAQN